MSTKMMVMVIVLAGCPPIYPDTPPPARPAMPKPTQAPEPVKRTETIEITKTVNGVTIETAPNRNIAWTLTIRNDTDNGILVLWDESNFVAANGHSWGRLVPDTTRKIDVGRAYPPMPVPAHAIATKTVLPDDMGPTYELGVDMTDHINGGRLVVTIQTPAGKQTWQAMITEH